MGDGVTGTIPCELFGGPLDGAKYGDLPDLGGSYTNASLALPLGQPAEEHPRALYTCRGAVPVNGLWQFFYERTEYPADAAAHAEVAAAPARLPLTPTGSSVKGSPFDGREQVALARGLALLAHRRQLDRDGTEISVHLARVAAIFDPQRHPLAHAAAWLHDTVKRTALSFDDLAAAGIHPAILHLVELLTRAPGMDDQRHYDRVKGNPLARAILLADIDDRSRRDRLHVLDDPTRERLQRRYRRARRLLTTQKEVAQ
ncbi:hypothetical protein H9651_01980 [Microbacterium sp. Sa4CUA7]|uniref:HD domain-containing protein n=1 Tax=Microbacterium pullorum TaxID=2762236 RepID=A0ABR8RYU6_9MICO|nr:hypothetical protein [Microbacterium pullorum]MBD7956401.1 hypothetical protein [Microbacterium pullorum]